MFPGVLRSPWIVRWVSVVLAGAACGGVTKRVPTSRGSGGAASSSTSPDDDGQGGGRAEAGGASRVQPGDHSSVHDDVSSYDSDDDSVTADDDATDEDDASASPPRCAMFEPPGNSECATQTVTGDPVPANILLLLDRSARMDEGPRGETGWLFVRDSLTRALSSHGITDNPYMSLGLMLFPGPSVDPMCSGAGCCALPDDAMDVDVDSAATTAPEIIERIGDTSVAGLAPTSAALAQALEYFQSGPGSTREGRKYVLLATAGSPGCNAELACSDSDCAPLLDRLCSPGCCKDEAMWLQCVDSQETEIGILDLAAVGVKTLVAGIPTTENYADRLDVFAVAGQASATTDGDDRLFYDISVDGSLDSLIETLESLTEHLVRTCTIPLTTAAVSFPADGLRFGIDCTEVPRANTVMQRASGEGGEQRSPTNWTIDDSTEPPSLKIMGAYCEHVQKGVDRLDVLFPCQPGM